MQDRAANEKFHSKQEAEAVLSDICRRLVELFPEGQPPADGWPVSIESPPGPGRRSGPRLPRVRVLPEDLLRPREEVLVVLLHGMVHFAHALAGVRDCSRGHYHNRKFRDLARQVGLEAAESRPRWGWAGTVATEALAERLAQLELPELPRLHPGYSSPQTPESLAPLAERPWRCGLNVAEPAQDDAWRARLAPPEVPRFRLVLVREQGVPVERYPKVETLPTAATLCWRLLGEYEREAVAVLFLDNRGRLIGYDIPYVGSLKQTGAEPRGVLLPALLANAARVVVAHNHPSGDPSPSEWDYQLTERLVSAGEILGIPVWASLVVAGLDQWREVHADQQELTARLRQAVPA